MESGHTQGSLDGAVTPYLHVSASCRLTPLLRAHVVLCGWPHVGSHSLRKGHTAFKNHAAFEKHKTRILQSSIPISLLYFMIWGGLLCSTPSHHLLQGGQVTGEHPEGQIQPTDDMILPLPHKNFHRWRKLAALKNRRISSRAQSSSFS